MLPQAELYVYEDEKTNQIPGAGIGIEIMSFVGKREKGESLSKKDFPFLPDRCLYFLRQCAGELRTIAQGTFHLRICMRLWY